MRATTRCRWCSASVSTPTAGFSMELRCVSRYGAVDGAGRRRLSSDSAGTEVGPIHYRVVEPLRAIQVSLDATEHAPISFDVELRGDFDAALEDPWPDHSPDGYRVTHNVLRYHQIGVASGWVDVEARAPKSKPTNGFRFATTPGVWRRRQADTGPAARRPQDQTDVHDLAADDDEPSGRIEIFAVRHVPGGAGRRIPRDPLSGQQQDPTVPPTDSLRWNRTCTSRTITALHARNGHADRH